MGYIIGNKVLVPLSAAALIAAAATTPLRRRETAEIKKKEDRMMRAYTNTTDKYACAELQAFAQKKETLQVKLAAAPGANTGNTGASGTSFGDVLANGLAQDLGSNIGAESVRQIRNLIMESAASIHDSTVKQQQRRKLLQLVMKNDPVIATYAHQNPGKLIAAYMTMRKFAPELSTDINVVTSFLRQAVLSGGVMDVNVIKTLAEAEAGVHKANNESHWWRR